VGHDQLRLAGFEIHMGDAGAFGRHVVEEAVFDSGVAVARPAIRHAGEVAGYGLPAIRTQCVNGRGQRALVACLHIEDVAHEVVLLAVIPDHFRFRPGNPLQHATLLPAPRASGAEGNPLVALLQVHHAHLDHVVRRR
jgi:hypothetical protein